MRALFQASNAWPGIFSLVLIFSACDSGQPIPNTNESDALSPLVTEPIPSPQFENISKIVVDPPLASIAVGMSLPLHATMILQDGSHQDATNLVSWQSTNESVASVNNNASSVSSYKSGKTIVTATFQQHTSSAEITVTDAQLTHITVQASLNQRSVAPNSELRITAIGHYTDKSELDLTAIVEWKSSEPELAYFTLPGTLVSGNPDSEVNFQVSAKLGSIESQMLQLTLLPDVLQSISISGDVTPLRKGEHRSYTLYADYASGVRQAITSLANISVNSSGTIESSIAETGELVLAALDTGTATLTAHYLGKTISLLLQVNSTAITRISIESSFSTEDVLLDSLIPFVAVAHYDDGHKTDVTHVATWNSNAPHVLHVGNSTNYAGLGTALSLGDVTVTAQIGEVIASRTLHVIAASVQSLNISTQQINVLQGSTVQLNALALVGSHAHFNITNDSAVQWHVSNPNLARVSNLPNNKGLVTLADTANGSVEVSVSYDTLQATVLLNVHPTNNVLAIEVTPQRSLVSLNDTIEFRLIGTLENGATIDLSSNAIWESSNPTILSLFATEHESIFMGKRAGLTVVRANFGALSAQANISVVSGTLEAIALSTSSASMAINSEFQLRAYGTFRDTVTNLVFITDITEDVIWSSNSKDIADFTGPLQYPGLLVSKQIGSTSISASFGNLNASTYITVLSAYVRIEILGLEKLYFGKPLTLWAVGILPDGNSQALSQASWNSDNNTVVGINHNENASITVTALQRNLNTTVNIELNYQGLQTSKSLQVIYDPLLPVALVFSAAENTLYIPKSETINLSVRVIAADPSVNVPDGTIVDISPLYGLSTSSNTVQTTNGKAEFSLTTSQAGTYNILAKLSSDKNIVGKITVFAVNNFSELFFKKVVVNFSVANNYIQAGGYLGAAIKNISNRTFDVTKLEVTRDNGVIVSISNDSNLLSEYLLTENERLFYSYYFSETVSLATYRITFWLKDRKTNNTTNVSLALKPT